jgi:iron complex outermembrane receptor protein
MTRSQETGSKRQETSFGGKENDLSTFPGHIALSCALLFATFVATPDLAFGQSEEAEPAPAEVGAEVIVIVPRARQSGVEDLRGESSEHSSAEESLGRAPFATIVQTAESEGERRTVSEVLARTVGVSARSLGGLGAFSSISVRGADASHTMVSVDGVPLSRIASVAANLGQFELGSFESLELYRGGVPPELGGAGVGGAVNMRTALGPGADGKALHLSAGLGSFGARHLRARWLGGEREGSRAFHVSAGYEGADGDFAFFDDGATPLNRADDQVVERQNNGYDRIGLLARGRVGSWTLGSRSSVQEQGLPGAAHDQALSTQLHTALEIADARYDREGLFGAGSLFHLRSFASLERQRFSDPDSEIGLLAQDSVYLTSSTGLGSGLVLEPGYGQRLLFDLDARLDWFRETPKSALGPMGARGNRQTLGLSISDQARFVGERLFVDTGLRVDALRTRAGADVFSGMEANEPVQRDWYVNPRVALRYRVGDSLAIKANGGRYLRAATLVEIFGDRGFVLGNTELRPERGLSSDLGLVWAPWDRRGPVDRIYLEAVGFASRSDDAIVFVNRNGLAAQAINLSGAQTLGAELVGSIRVRERVTMTSHYSYLDARNRSGGAAQDKQLPGRPRHRVYARVDAAFEPRGRLLVLWADALRLSGNFVDELNVYELPARSLVGAGIKTAITGDLLLGLEIKNAADLRSESVTLDPAPSDEFRQTPRALSDLHGYPLPGRSLYLTLHWSH